MSADTIHAPVPSAPEHGRRYLALPHTLLGRWSAALFAAFWVLLALFFAAVSAGARGFVWPLWGTIIPAAVCAISGLITGVFAVVRKQERSLLVFLAVAWGTFVAWFVSMELLFPH
jgi:hypothetical protein